MDNNRVEYIQYWKCWSKCAIGHTRMSLYDQGDILFLCRATADSEDCTMSDKKNESMINRFGSVGIRTNNLSNILQVGDGACIRISKSESDNTVKWAKQGDNATNTRIVLSDNTRASPCTGNLENVST
jgi:hypothetical protein